MEISEILDIAIPVVYILVGVALIVFVIELIKFLRSTTKTIDQIKAEIDPTLAHVESLTASLEPVVTRVDPLVERVSLTVDAANLEIMRVDQILENVADITGSLSSATEAVDTAANAPMKLVNTASEKVRGVFKSRKASDESIALGNGKAAGKKEEALPEGDAAAQYSKAETSYSLDNSFEDVSDLSAEAASNKVAAEHLIEESEEVTEAIEELAEKPTTDESKNGYFTYTPDKE